MWISRFDDVTCEALLAFYGGGMRVMRSNQGINVDATFAELRPDCSGPQAGTRRPTVRHGSRSSGPVTDQGPALGDRARTL